MVRLSAVLGAALALLVLSGCAPQPPIEPPGDRPFYEFLLDELRATELSPAEQDAAFAAGIREREDLIAECMREQGFEYEADLSAIEMRRHDREMGRLDPFVPRDREWLAQYGWGFVDNPEKRIDEEFYESIARPWNPSALTPAEDEARILALYGPPSEDSEVPAPLTERGCWGQAQSRAGSPEEIVWESAEFAALMSDVLVAQTRVQPSDPRMVALDAEWSHCMADAGFPDIEQQAAVQTTWLQMAYPEDAPFSEPGDDLIALEIQLALADFDCRDATGFDEREREIRLDIENRLLAENRAVVDELLALVQSVRS